MILQHAPLEIQQRRCIVIISIIIQSKVDGKQMGVLNDVVALNIPNTTDDCKCQGCVAHVHTLHDVKGR